MRWFVMLAICGCSSQPQDATCVGTSCGDPVDPPLAESCVGQPGGLLPATCLTPTDHARVFSGLANLDTSTLVGCHPSRTDACFITANQIIIETQTILELGGSRPIVLWAAQTIEVHDGGVIDASTTSSTGPDRKTGPGANPSACTTDTLDAPPDSDAAPSISSGGGGGSYATTGGSGGLGRRGPAITIATVPGPTRSAALLGGCRGGRSGDVVLGGDGGGAVYLMAGTSIIVAGTIHAFGGGGVGGVGDGSQRLGGGGGGSGGLIGLDAPSIHLADANLIALGGGGGGGAGTGNGGDGSEVGFTPAIAQALGGTQGIAANDGGAGSPLRGGGGAGGGDVGANSDGGGGGGGGGAGYILRFGEITEQGTVTIAPQ